MTATIPAAPRITPVRRLSSFVATTPGLLTVWAAAVVTVAVLAGAVTIFAVRDRDRSLQDLTQHSGPMSVATQELYRSLSDADATANGTFLAGGLEPVDVRRRYETDVAQAGNALAIAVAAQSPAEISVPDSPLAVLSTQLPVYTGLVETARANNRQGLPVGAAYQREASALMRDTLLPAAQRLYESEREAVAEDQRRAWVVPFVEFLVGALLLTLLILTQRFLRRRTNRVFNTGLLAATASATVALLWVLATSTFVIISVERSRAEGSAQVDLLAQARFATLKARADETLTLVARGAGGANEAAYLESIDQLEKSLRQARREATDDALHARIDLADNDFRDWRRAHAAVRAADDGGDYTTAVQLAIQRTPRGAVTAFDTLDRHLSEAIDHTRSAFSTRIHQASSALTGITAGVAVLAMFTAAAATVGIWQRLKEYR